MNVDADFQKNSGVGLGAIIRDVMGRVVSAVSRWSTLVVELKAINLGLVLAKRTGVSNLVVEYDNLTAVRVVEGAVQYRNEVGMVANEIRAQLGAFSSVSFFHANRLGSI